jgi:hypothetical protein
MLSGNCPLTSAGNRTKPSETLLGEWIKFGWMDILPESIIKGFKNFCVTWYEWSRRWCPVGGRS